MSARRASIHLALAIEAKLPTCRPNAVKVVHGESISDQIVPVVAPSRSLNTTRATSGPAAHAITHIHEEIAQANDQLPALSQYAPQVVSEAAVHERVEQRIQHVV